MEERGNNTWTNNNAYNVSGPAMYMQAHLHLQSTYRTVTSIQPDLHSSVVPAHLQISEHGLQVLHITTKNLTSQDPGFKTLQLIVHQSGQCQIMI